MPWTITRLCRDCVDTGCVSVCPVDCIYEYVGPDKVTFPNQLYIDPDECIDCGACEPECPWQAIFEEPAVPDVLKDDIALNHALLELKDQFKVMPFKKIEHPTAEQVAENKKKWGVDPNS
jgi:ferredoxin